MNNINVGYSKISVTPPLGINIPGYFVERKAETILDELYASAVAFECAGKRSVVIALDHIGIERSTYVVLRDYICEKNFIAEDELFLSCSHTHTGPSVDVKLTEEIEQKYLLSLKEKLSEVVRLSLLDLKPAKIGYGIGTANRISFVRRFRMKDGSVRTNPGVNNPDILEPIGTVDERVNVIRIDREDAETVVIVNFGVHPDVIGGNNISADYPGFVRNTVERALDNVKCVFLNGMQGDVNHVNVMPRPGEENGLLPDFDDVKRGYPHSKHMGNVIAAAVLSVYEKVKYIETDSIRTCEVSIAVPSNRPDPSEIPLATKYNDLHLAGKDAEIPYKGMALTTEVARAARMIKLKDGPDSFDVTLSAFAIGNIAFVGLAGEPFTGIGIGLKSNKNFELVLPCALTNGSEGYFPMMDSYAEGGYEAATSIFKPGVAELLIEKGNEILNEL